MIALGIILAVLGYFFSHILMVLGIILLVAGLVFHFMGTAGRPVAGRRLRVEIRTVNHRYFNLSAKLPGDLSSLEGELRERLRRDFERGHVTIQARWTENAEREAGFEVDLDRARIVAARLRELQNTLGLSGEVTIDLVARQPDVVGSRANGAGEIAWTEVEPVVAQAGAECRAMRAREGKALTEELGHRLALLTASTPRGACADHARGKPAGRDPGAIQRLADINIAEPGDDALVEQRRLDRGLLGC